MPEILAFLNRPDALRALARPWAVDTCACGTLRIGYVPERRVGRVTHGKLACYREEAKP